MTDSYTDFSDKERNLDKLSHALRQHEGRCQPNGWVIKAGKTFHIVESCDDVYMRLQLCQTTVRLGLHKYTDQMSNDPR